MGIDERTVLSIQNQPNSKIFHVHEVNIGSYKDFKERLEKKYYTKDIEIINEMIENIKEATRIKVEIFELLGANKGKITEDEKININKLDKKRRFMFEKNNGLQEKLSETVKPKFLEALVEKKSLLY